MNTTQIFVPGVSAPELHHWHKLQRLVEHTVSVPASALSAKLTKARKKITAPYKQTPRPPGRQLTQEDLRVLSEVVSHCARRFGYRAEQEDLYQDMAYELLRTRLMDRYDPSRSSRWSYIHQFVHHRCCNRYGQDSKTRNRFVSWEDAPQEEQTNALEQLDVMLLSQIDQVASELQVHYPSDTAVVYDHEYAIRGVASWRTRIPRPMYPLWRSHTNVFRLLCLGVQQYEIARMMRLDKGGICRRVDDIREWPGMLELYIDLKHAAMGL